VGRDVAALKCTGVQGRGCELRVEKQSTRETNVFRARPAREPRQQFNETLAEAALRRRSNLAALGVVQPGACRDNRTQISLDHNAIVANPNRICDGVVTPFSGARHRFDHVLIACRLETERFRQLAVDARDGEVTGLCVDRNGARRAPLAVSPRRPPLREAGIAHNHQRIVKRRRAESIFGVREVGVDFDRRLRKPRGRIRITHHASSSDVAVAASKVGEQFRGRERWRAGCRRLSRASEPILFTRANAALRIDDRSRRTESRTRYA
jgi:hypothetical protein